MSNLDEMIESSKRQMLEMYSRARPAPSDKVVCENAEFCEETQSGGKVKQKCSEMDSAEGEMASSGGQVSENWSIVVSGSSQTSASGGKVESKGCGMCSEGGEVESKGCGMCSEGGETVSEGGGMCSEGGETVSEGGGTGGWYDEGYEQLIYTPEICDVGARSVGSDDQDNADKDSRRVDDCVSDGSSPDCCASDDDDCICDAVGGNVSDPTAPDGCSCGGDGNGVSDCSGDDVSDAGSDCVSDCGDDCVSDDAADSGNGCIFAAFCRFSVTDSVGGQPIAGAQVIIRMGARLSIYAVTDCDGLTMPLALCTYDRSADCAVTVLADSYFSVGSAPVALTVGQDTLIPVRLDPMPNIFGSYGGPDRI